MHLKNETVALIIIEITISLEANKTNTFNKNESFNLK